MEVLDTNLIIRHLTQDNPEHSERARIVFAAVEAGERQLKLPEGVLVEAVQVLSSKNLYNLPRPDIHRHLTRLIKLPNIKIAPKRTYLRALDLYLAQPALSFVDCLCIAYAERESDAAVLSFDAGYDRSTVRAATRVRRNEP